MNWTDSIDVNAILSSHALMCGDLDIRAMMQAQKNGIDYDLNMDTYVADFFGGVQPSPDQFLDFLAKKGIDAEAIKLAQVEFIQGIEPERLRNKEKAEAFFRLFQTEWHILQKDIEKYITEDSIYHLLELAVSDAASTKARLSAIKMHATNPKQKEKAMVKECWCDWQKEPDRYKGKAAFARDMREKFLNLESQPVIEGWCRAWERET
jgi:hypothetical protein